jgi:phosphatidylglycerophosphatase A
MSLSPLPRGRFDAAWMIATWFGCGLSPVAPGTAGSLAGLVIAIALNLAFGWGPLTFLLLAAILTAPGIWAATVIEKREGIEDPGKVVVDEVIGQWVTLAGAPVLNWKTFLVGFALFRLFDVLKPPPARQFERLPGGWGIVADDVMAGVYGALAIFVLGWLHLF